MERKLRISPVKYTLSERKLEDSPATVGIIAKPCLSNPLVTSHQSGESYKDLQLMNIQRRIRESKFSLLFCKARIKVLDKFQCVFAVQYCTFYFLPRSLCCSSADISHFQYSQWMVPVVSLTFFSALIDDKDHLSIYRQSFCSGLVTRGWDRNFE